MATTYVLAKCQPGDRCKVRLVMDVDDAGIVQVPCWKLGPGDQRTEVIAPMPVQQAIPYLVWCVEHKRPMRGKPLRVSRGDRPCTAACMRSASGDCRCSCGGANHGVYA